MNDQIQTTGAALFASMLQAYGAKVIFGVPGDTNVSLYNAIAGSGGAMRHVLARDERSAGFMADAYARISNRPGLVEVPSGAGPMYALPAVAEAHESSVPVILITGDMPLAYEGRGVISELDCAKLLEPVTKASILVKRANKIPETVRRAFRIATTGRPGAVQIVVPEDVQDEQVPAASVSMRVEAACRTFPAYPAHAGPAELIELQRLLVTARRPLLVAGGGVNRSVAATALTRVAERYRVPVVTTMTGQGAIADRHELSLGVVGDNGFHPHANRAMEEADLLVYIGCRNGSVVSIGWTFPSLRAGRRIAQIDICPEFLANNSDNILSIHGDARCVLQQLLEVPLAQSWHPDSTWIELVDGWRRDFWDAAPAPAIGAGRSALRPRVVIEALNQRLKTTHFLFSDPGTPTPYLNRYLRLHDSTSRVIMARGFGGLGYAIPAVVGSWFARPDVRPIGLFGDGSFGMAVGELETLVRLKVPAILMNFNNSAFGWIKALQQVRGHQGMSVDFSAQDASAIAAAFGLRAVRVRDESELAPALDMAFAHDGPVFLDLVVESVAEVMPPVFNWMRKTGRDPKSACGD